MPCCILMIANRISIITDAKISARLQPQIIWLARVISRWVKILFSI